MRDIETYSTTPKKKAFLRYIQKTKGNKSHYINNLIDGDKEYRDFIKNNLGY